MSGIMLRCDHRGRPFEDAAPSDLSQMHVINPARENFIFEYANIKMMFYLLRHVKLVIPFFNRPMAVVLLWFSVACFWCFWCQSFWHLNRTNVNC